MLPLVIFEYFALLWFMSSGGFALAASLIVFALCMAGHLWPFRKYKERVILRSVLLISALVTSPFITMVVVVGLARAFGIEIVVQ